MVHIGPRTAIGSLSLSSLVSVDAGSRVHRSAPSRNRQGNQRQTRSLMRKLAIRGVLEIHRLYLFFLHADASHDECDFALVP